VTGHVDVGGLVGEIGGTISRSYSNATVVQSGSGANVGGLVGAVWASNLSGSLPSSHNAVISNSASTGAVSLGTGGSVNSSAGGLIGGIYRGGTFSATVESSYSAGAVSGSSFTGGLIGSRNAFGSTVTNSYWDTQTSGQSTSAGGVGLTTATLKSGLPPGFDENKFWHANPGQYPALGSSIVQNAVTVGPSPDGHFMLAAFTPNFGLSISDAASKMGFTNFNWQQKITYLPSPSPYIAVIDKSKTPLTAPPAFSDPVQGGYTYNPSGTMGFPFYYDAAKVQENVIFPGEILRFPFFNTGSGLPIFAHSNSFLFSDAPSDNCLIGGSGADCGGATVPDNVLSEIVFTTSLVGVLPDGESVPLAYWDWATTFNGTVEGVSVLNSSTPVDPDSGTGGVILLSDVNYLMSDVNYPLAVPFAPFHPLSTTGLVALGLLYWRRKRKGATALAA